MAIHQVRLARREQVAEGTSAFHFERPPGFEFKPGQAVDVVLDERANGDGRHAFSIVSAPFEGELVIATRMRDTPYKRALGALAVGDAVKIDGPFGSMTLHQDRNRGAVFIAGGIGITPFMSMLRQAFHDDAWRQIALAYSNRRPEDTALLAELTALERANGNFRLLPTMTDMAKSGIRWNGATRLIDAALIAEAADGLPSPIYYVAGPPAMVEAVRKTLNDAGVSDDDIRSEEFFGY